MDETIDINNTLPFEGGNPSPSIIKVIGVGGGGGNAVNHMYKTGIEDVTFVLCNTDRQALANSDIPRKLQIGKAGEPDWELAVFLLKEEKLQKKV